ncbi:type IV pilus biogenesis/stability protein PilW [Shewanella eurypsychrophilus]|uniref:Type IV pilus biogenesis/stability protein PilW n=1 Tax=Shewanella eurypsychrophilus TaxID=2593656 RepID=A0ABX6VAC8_9GAMM|nr:MULTISPECIES: type IV pilus biogenesis/stability protein PilW [Shewanella]QFU23559.1 type IV pilus biogenesis/stability protein PilW [Shewanella sp. YLB-09]QPG58785.1 type IV pilus biogenesis/stability protein PilW [Shewanella eurypsychrophilus]
MMHGLLRITPLIILSASMLTGCVSQELYSGTDIPVAERAFDNVAAAKQRAQLGLTYLQKGNSEQAKFNLNKAVGFAPDIEAVNVSMAYYYQTVGELESAENYYRKAINSSDATGDGMNNFGVFLCKQKKFPESEAVFLRAIKMPAYTRAAASYENLGICSRKAGQLEKAQKYFGMALQYDPRRQVSLIELTEIDVETGDYLKARTQLVRYHRVVVESAESLTLGITIEQGLNDLDAARRFGILLLAKFPASVQAKQYRASMH